MDCLDFLICKNSCSSLPLTYLFFKLGLVSFIGILKFLFILSCVYVANAYFHPMACLFTYFMVSFNEQKFLILMESNLLVFSLWLVLFVSCFKTLFLPSGQEYILLCGIIF